MTPTMPARLCTRIRGVIREDYNSLPSRNVYRLLGDIWGTSSGTAWRLIHVENYWPSSKRIQRVLREKARERGIVIESRERVRVELSPGIGKEDLKAIRELSTAERTAILIRGINE